ncbi:MAG: polyamine aminopropyltransferase [Lentisphaeria bacterium]|nr:polyamine aminopropyltransferase [Lentisphaeria bacterium]
MNTPGLWVTENEIGFPAMTLPVKRVLYSGQTPFQKIDLYETELLGKLLMLDEIVQLASYDEFAYHEMMANLPFYAAEAPRRALVIGGGDGGVLRELGKHPELEVLDICEIDAEVIRVCREFLPETACGYDDPRVNIHIADGSVFIKDKPEYYDIIVVDSTDPGGPGEPLFGEAFYADLKKALRPGGVIATQAESPYLLPALVNRLGNAARANFNCVRYASIMVPTYPTGMIGCCVAGDIDVTVPKRTVSKELAENLRYYNSEIHSAAFANPNFISRIINRGE